MRVEEVTTHAKPWRGQFVSHNASEGIEPRNYSHCIGSRVSFPGNQYQDTRLKVRVSLTCGGLSPWRANGLFILELGRTEAYQLEVAKKQKMRRGGMAFR